MNPAEQEARADAERSGQIVGNDVDRLEAAILADVAGEGEPVGAWLDGEVPA